ncbi:uncharacterized protein A4U43_C08F2410 [Asparagus officinalis]|nr:uncharacterized protein A4U43_C08F2410 [Asparagus officinalis]
MVSEESFLEGTYLNLGCFIIALILAKHSNVCRFSYFLPYFIISLFVAGVLSVCFWLPETLHYHPESKTAGGAIEPLQACLTGSDTGEKDVGNEKGIQPNKENILSNWPLKLPTIVCCVFSLRDTAYNEIFSLWAESDRKLGGLSFSYMDVGEILTIPLVIACPFMSKLSGSILSLVNCASILKNVLSVALFTGLFISQNNAVPQHQRGAANVISMTAQSVSRAIAPACAGAL